MTATDPSNTGIGRRAGGSGRQPGHPVEVWRARNAHLERLMTAPFVALARLLLRPHRRRP
jgi:hypothetical protein